MNATHEFARLFWINLAMAAGCAVVAYVLVRRRHLWVRLLDAEESFWLRLGFSKHFAGFGRGFAESRFYTISFVFFTALFLLLAAVCGGFYFHFKQHHRQTAGWRGQFLCSISSRQRCAVDGKNGGGNGDSFRPGSRLAPCRMLATAGFAVLTRGTPRATIFNAVTTRAT
jgi:hypothetical protein